MKDSTKNALNKLFKLTCERCNSICPSTDKYRCCDKIFCSIVERNLISPIEKPNLGNIPYMGPNGCVVPPEFRPQCVGFMCETAMDDRTFRRKYQRIVNDVNKEKQILVLSKWSK